MEIHYLIIYQSSIKIGIPHFYGKLCINKKDTNTAGKLFTFVRWDSFTDT